MNTLFILGNGFDLAHNLPTSYLDFREYIESHDYEFFIWFEELFGMSPVDENDPYTNYEKTKEERGRILWASLEKNMVNIDVSRIIDLSDSIGSQLHLDGGNIGIEDMMDDYWEKEFGFICELPLIVRKWIESIDLSNIQPKCEKLTKSTEIMFLSFNYTATLEKCYGIDPDQILHIHGSVPPYSDINPIIGHGYNEGILEHRKEAKYKDEAFSEGRASIERAIANIFERSLKNTEDIIREHHYYFSQLTNIESIIIFGLSYSEIDLPYLEEIKRHVKPTARWTMYYHTCSDLVKLKQAIISLNLNETLVEYINE